MLQALALGSNTIKVTRGALEVSGGDELAGLLAHEAAHVHHKDSMLNLALIGMTGVTVAQGWWMKGWIWGSIAVVLWVFAMLKGVFFTWVTP